MKAWQRDRMAMLYDAIWPLTLAQEQEIERICEEEKQYIRSRPTMKSLVSLKEPMTDARNDIKEKWLPLTDSNSWVNPRSREKEHIALKFLNWSDEEWAEMGAATKQKQDKRLEEQKFINDPDAVTSRAIELLESSQWSNIVVGLAACTGRRLSELMKEGKFSPKTRYTILFEGQLKKKDEYLPPYEIPTLAEAHIVLSALERLRSLVDCSAVPVEQIGKTYSSAAAAAADAAFADLVPARADGNLFTHLFRAVYGRIATFYYALPETADLKYMATIYGHYWVLKATGEKQQNYMSTLHYYDYQIGDAAIMAYSGKRQGVRLGLPGVEVLEIFSKKRGQHMDTQDKEIEEGTDVQDTEEQEETLHTEQASKTGRSTMVPSQGTKQRLEKVRVEIAEQRGITEAKQIKKQIKDDMVLSLVCDEHDTLKLLQNALGDAVEPSALGLVAALLQDAHANALEQVEALKDAKQEVGNESGDPVVYLRSLLEQRRSSSALVAVLLQDAHADALEQAQALKGMGKKAENETGDPIVYLRGLLEQKRRLKETYAHGRKKVSKDFSTMSMQELKDERSAEASLVRWERGANAIMAYNKTVPQEGRWYLNATMMNILVGGKPDRIQAYLDTRKDEIEAHHKEYNIIPSANKKGGVKITDRVKQGLEPSAVGHEETAEIEETEATAESVEA